MNTEHLYFVSFHNIKDKVTDANPSPIRMIKWSDHEKLMHSALNSQAKSVPDGTLQDLEDSDYVAKRFRLILTKLGISTPESDEELLLGAFSYLGMARRALDEILTPPQQAAKRVPDETVKRMVDAFLGWPLPDDFAPDCGISFTNKINEGTEIEHQYNPIGTNLFTADQAKAMVEYMLSATPQQADKVRELEKDAERYRWLRNKASDIGICAVRIDYWSDEYWEQAHCKVYDGELLDKAIDKAMKGE